MSYGVDSIYLDHAATTPVDLVVLEAMLPWFSQRFGNPSSIYQLGQEARAALDDARAAVAQVLECHPGEIVFTSGATESNNLALRGVAWAARAHQADGAAIPHLVTTAIEHHAVLSAAEGLERQDFSVTFVQPDSDGIVPVSAISAAIRPETCLISVMYANNETGAIQSIVEIAEVARANGIIFHTDAVQAAGFLDLDVDVLGVDLLSLTGHKLYGPKGTGMLFVRTGTDLDFQQVGGGQEQGRRGGTENVPGIVGFAVALQRANAWKEEYAAHCAALRDQLWEGISSVIPGAELNGPRDFARRLPNNLNASLPGVLGETILLSLDMLGVAASAGSACTTGKTEPSHVLRAMGISDELCRSALRFTVGRENTSEQIDEALDAIVEAVRRAQLLAGAAAV